MLVSLCYAAERITYGAKSSLDRTDVEFQRQKIVDYILHLLIMFGAYQEQKSPERKI